MMDFRDNIEKCQEYVNALEEERKKIQVFQRELPLCFDLVTQAIEACKQQLSGSGRITTTECFNGHSECSEQTTSDGPILEEFIPIKRSHSPDDDHVHDDDDNEMESDKLQINNNNNLDKSSKKSDWLRSVQLWNQTPDPPTTTQQDDSPKKVAVVEVKRNGSGGAFHPFQKEKNNNENEKNCNNNNNNNNKQDASTPAVSACSSAQETDVGPSNGGSGGSGDGGNKKEDKSGQSQRKSRRCWSPELHRRFVHALQQLGGSHVATPKQIRDLMKVDGLTNDEVKSHLQKYRLHTRRPSSGVHNNANQQAPQFVVVGGIWMPPQEYAAVAAATTSGETSTVAPPTSIYAPIATVAAPPHLHKTSTHRQQASQSHCEERASHSEGRVRSNSPATSSSTHTTTASHAH